MVRTCPTRQTPDWVMQRVRRCEARIWETARALAKRGQDVVLDTGAMRVADRLRVAQACAAAGLSLQTHFVTAQRELRRDRVAQRNAQRGDTYAFDISPSVFEWMDRLFEAPTDQELAIAETVPPA